jgi:hypothetical protein
MASRSSPGRWWLYGNFLIGDLIMQTPAIRALKAREPEAEIHYVLGDRTTSVVLEGNHYLSQIHLLEQDIPVTESLLATQFSCTDADRRIQMAPGSAMAWGERHRRTMVEGFGGLLGVEVHDLRYDYFMSRQEREDGRDLVREIGNGKTVVIVARHSASCTSNDPRIGFPNKCVNNRIWVAAAHWLLGEGFVPVAVGSAQEAQDERYSDWPGERVYGLPLRTVAGLLAAARATLTIDNGIRHLAAAVGGSFYCLTPNTIMERLHSVPVRPAQRILEEHRALSSISVEHLIAGAMQVLAPPRAQ